ncbi:MAG TPA: TIGR03557 family F420-dependent LLM class oxidoreductase, partial [Chloroflexota bacterium]
MLLGYKASAEQFGPKELLEFAIQAEHNGFDSVFVSDHFQPWRDTNGHAPSSLVWLGALSQRTERVQMGTSVLTPTFRYHPTIVAQAFATLACLEFGRVILGVGTGESLNEAPILDEPWPEFKERFARLREAIALIKRLWTEDFVTFEGTYFRTHNAKIYDRPSDPPKLYVAAGGPQMAKYAGRVSDGMIVTSGKGMELYAEKLLPAFVEGAEASGRSPDALERMIEMKVSFDTDRER